MRELAGWMEEAPQSSRGREAHRRKRVYSRSVARCCHVFVSFFSRDNFVVGSNGRLFEMAAATRMMTAGRGIHRADFRRMQPSPSSFNGRTVGGRRLGTPQARAGG